MKKKEIIKKFPLAWNFYKLPVKYDSYGQMIFDKDNNLMLDVRGWGRIQKTEQAEKRQDQIGEMIATIINDALS